MGTCMISGYFAGGSHSASQSRGLKTKPEAPGFGSEALKPETLINHNDHPLWLEHHSYVGGILTFPVGGKEVVLVAREVESCLNSATNLLEPAPICWKFPCAPRGP